MAIRASSFGILSAAAFAVVASSFAAPAPAAADEDPHYRAPRYRTHVPRVRTVRPVPVRTVVRVRTRVVCYDYNGQPFDCRDPAPVAPQPVYQNCGGCAPVVPQPIYQGCGGCAPVVQYAPQPVYVPAPAYYGSGCGGCGSAAMPYAWTAGYRYRHRHAYYGY